MIKLSQLLPFFPPGPQNKPFIQGASPGVSNKLREKKSHRPAKISLKIS